MTLDRVPGLGAGGHTQGVLSLSWCPDDPSLLCSCGRDNKTLLWDLYTTRCVYELDSSEEEEQLTAMSGFDSSAGGFGSQSGFGASVATLPGEDAAAMFGGGQGSSGFGAASRGSKGTRRYQVRSSRVHNSVSFCSCCGFLERWRREKL